MFRQFKPYATAEVGFAAGAVLGFMLLLVLYLQITGAQGELTQLRDEYTAATTNLRTQRLETATKAQQVETGIADLERRRTESAAFQEAASVSSLTSLNDAESLGTRLVAYAAANGLDIGDFTTTRGPTTIGGIEFTAFNYSFTAQGGPSGLIGLLGIAGDIRTARVASLRLTRDSEDASVWSMTLGLIVPYGDEKT